MCHKAFPLYSYEHHRQPKVTGTCLLGKMCGLGGCLYTKQKAVWVVILPPPLLGDLELEYRRASGTAPLAQRLPSVFCFFIWQTGTRIADPRVALGTQKEREVQTPLSFWRLTLPSFCKCTAPVCISKSALCQQFSVGTLGGAWEVPEVLSVLRLTGEESWQVWGPLWGNLI